MIIRNLAVASMVISLMISGIGRAESASRTSPGTASKGGYGSDAIGVLRQLHYSDSQKQQIHDILRKYYEDSSKVTDQLAQSRLAKFNAVNAESYDEAAIRAACRQVAAGEESVAVLQAKVISQVRPILTPDQQAELKAFRERKQQEMLDRLSVQRERPGSWIEPHRLTNVTHVAGDKAAP